jgi:hypothetical protein
LHDAFQHGYEKRQKPRLPAPADVSDSGPADMYVGKSAGYGGPYDCSARPASPRNVSFCHNVSLFSFGCSITGIMLFVRRTEASGLVAVSAARSYRVWRFDKVTGYGR